MPTIVLDPPPPGLEALIETRRRLGQDRCDEVWDGALHMIPAPSGPHAVLSAQLAELLGPVARAAGLVTSGDFNLGEHKDDFRVPDLGVHRTSPTAVWVPTAAIVIEVISPGDETREKLPFYATQDVDEILLVDLASRSVRWLGLQAGKYRPVEGSALLDLSAAGLQRQIAWPQITQE